MIWAKKAICIFLWLQRLLKQIKIRYKKEKLLFLFYMIQFISIIIIFCIVLFFYLHIQFHLKTSDDLEIFEMESSSKERLEEICNFRQPVLFDLEPEHNKIIHTTNKDFLLEQYPVFEIKIREDIREFEDELKELYIPLPFHTACKLFQEDKKSHYFTENNQDFLTETGAIKNMQQNDEYLRPDLVSNCHYDILMGSTGIVTPFRYDINYRNYYMVTQGSIQIKLAPPKSTKYLYPINDYENFEFRSPINPWKIQDRYKNDFDKIKCLEITLIPGKCFYIPAYWWYSFKFSANTSVSCFHFRTYMNNVAISPHIFMFTLQNMNVTRKTVKQLDLQNKNTEKEYVIKNIKDN